MRRLPRIKSYNKRTPPHSTNWPGTDAGLLADDESVSPKTKGKDTCSSWTRRSPTSRQCPPRPIQKPASKSKLITVARNARSIGTSCRQIRHNHDLDEADKPCSCCGPPMKCIGEDVTRELEYQPAKLEAHIHVRPKYACPRCQDGVSAAPLPPRPIPGGIAGPGLITEVIVGKFGDHLPLYRLEDILTRYGVYISRSTLCDWMKAVADLLRPLYDLQRQRVLQSSVMWTDDTHVTVLGGAQGSFQGLLLDVHRRRRSILIPCTTSRPVVVATARHVFWQDIHGYLHADAYTGYDAIYLDVASASAKLPVGPMRGESSSRP